MASRPNDGDGFRLLEALLNRRDRIRSLWSNSAVPGRSSGYVLAFVVVHVICYSFPSKSYQPPTQPGNPRGHQRTSHHK